MKIVLQRVKKASVEVEGKTVGAIEHGLLVFIGFSSQDTESIAHKMIQKICALRIFNDENGKMNLSIRDVEGGILAVSQFTLYGDCKKGRRPSFVNAEKPAQARYKYDNFLIELQKQYPKVASGEFGADMDVSLINDGPVTMILDSDALF